MFDWDRRVGTFYLRDEDEGLKYFVQMARMRRALAEHPQMRDVLKSLSLHFALAEDEPDVDGGEKILILCDRCEGRLRGDLLMVRRESDDCTCPDKDERAYKIGELSYKDSILRKLIEEYNLAVKL